MNSIAFPATLSAALENAQVAANNVITGGTLVTTGDGNLSVALTGSADQTAQTFVLTATGVTVALTDLVAIAPMGYVATALEALTDSNGVLSSLSATAFTLSGSYDGTNITAACLQVTLAPTVSSGQNAIASDPISLALISANFYGYFAATFSSCGLSLAGTISGTTNSPGPFNGSLCPNLDSTWTLIASEPTNLPAADALVEWLDDDLADSWSSALTVSTFGSATNWSPARLEWTFGEDASAGFLGLICSNSNQDVTCSATLAMPAGISDVALPWSPKGGTPTNPATIAFQNVDPDGSSSLPFDSSPDEFSLTEFVTCYVPEGVTVISVVAGGHLTILGGAITLNSFSYTVVVPPAALVQNTQRFLSAQVGIGGVPTTLTALVKGVAPVTWTVGISANFTGCGLSVGNLFTAFNVPAVLAEIYFAGFSLKISPAKPPPCTATFAFTFSTVNSPQPNQIYSAIYWYGPVSQGSSTAASALCLGPLSFDIDLGDLLNVSAGLPTVNFNQISLLYSTLPLATVPSSFPPSSTGLPQGFSVIGPQISLTENNDGATLGATRRTTVVSRRRIGVGDGEQGGGEASTNATVPVEAKTSGLELDSLQFSFNGSTLNIDVSGAIGFYSNKLGFIDFCITQPLALTTPDFSLFGLALQMGDPAKPPAVCGALHLALDNDDGIQIEGLLAAIGELSMTIGFIGGQSDSGGFGFGFLVLNKLKLGDPAAQVTALALAAGVGMTMPLPTLAGMSSFPLVTLLNNQNNSGNALDGLYDVFEQLFEPLAQVTPGQNCVAIGVNVSTFQLLSTTAILDVTWGDSLTIDLFGQAQALFPPQSTPAEAKTALTLAFNGTVLPSEGLLQVLFQVVPGSYLFRLSDVSPSKTSLVTGGGAFCVWFSGDYGGAFVATVGGYPASWTPPSEYPAVPRLAITWQPTSSLSCVGEAYFTICSKGIMAGMALQATWAGSVGSALTYNLSLDLTFDAEILWNPFGFELDSTIQISVSATISLGIVSFGVHLTVGASLTLAGTPFYGTFSLYIQSWALNCPFGDPPTSPNTLSWSEIETSLMPSGSNTTSAIEGGPRGVGDATGTPQPVAIQVTGGNVPSKTQDPSGGGALVVDPGTFAFTVTSFVPLLTAAVLSEPTTTFPQATTLGVTPMVGQSAALSVSDLAITLPGATTSDFGFTATVTNAPTAMWTIASTESPPTDGSADPNSIQVVTAIAVAVQLPTLDAANSSQPALLSVLLSADNDPVTANLPSATVLTANAYGGDAPYAMIADIDTLATASSRANVVTAFAALGFPVQASAVNLTGFGPPDTIFRSPPVLREIGAIVSSSS